jgi:TonB-linked SusC/RagA family outer membrane protein
MKLYILTRCGEVTRIKKIFRVMKLPFVLPFAVFLLLSVAGNAQKVTYSGKNVSLAQVFAEINRQTGYLFLYTNEMLTGSKSIDFNVNNASLEEVLNISFADQPLTYAISNKTIVVTRKPLAQERALQQMIITGKLTDSKGETMPGVTVQVKGNGKSTMTDVNGNYALPVPDANAVLVFTFIGFTTKEVKVGTSKKIDVALATTQANLDEIVVIGYGTQRREDINGSVSSVKASDIAAIPQASVDQMLQGKAAGITVTQNSGAPGSQTSVHIRGIASFGAAEPLYVIDGVEVSGAANANGNQSFSANTGAYSPSPLALLNPNDIESIDILKDASAAAIYGNRAANGVIIITTKKGKTGSARISYDGYSGVQQAQKFLKLMNLRQYAKLQNSLYDAYGMTRRDELASPDLLGEGTDWQRAIFRTANMQSHQLSVSGGKEGLTYYISGGYFDQDGIAIGSSFKRYSFRSNLDIQVKPWAKVGLIVSGSRTSENIVYSDQGGIIYNALLQAPEVAIYNSDGSYAGPPDTPDAISGVINPVQQAVSIYNRLNRYNINGNLYNEIKFLKNFTLRSELGGDFGFSDSKVFNPSYSYGRFKNPIAVLREQNGRNTYWNWKEYLTYRNVFQKKHDVTALLGYQLNSNYYNNVQSTISDFLVNNLGNEVPTLGLGNAATAIINEQKTAPHNMESAFARVIYTYDHKYSVTATLRSDVSSNFAKGNQRGYFPSFAASWRLSEEPFLQKLKNSDIKLRLGYGHVGNEAIPAYAFGSKLVSSPTGLGTGFLLDRIANPDLQWEHHEEYDAGLDFSIVNNRIKVTVDYFERKSSKFLFQLPLPGYVVGGSASTGGISPPFVNAGGITNNGFEFTINSRNLTGKLKWNTTAIFSRYKNKVTSLANGLPYILQTYGSTSIPITRTRVGGPLGEFYGYRVKGTFKTEEQLRTAPVQFGNTVSNDPSKGARQTWYGDLQYRNLNDDKVIDASDQEALGSPQPAFTFGLTNNFSYKSFDLGVFVQGSYGGKILSMANRILTAMTSVYQNQLASQANFWTPDNRNSNVPAPRASSDNSNVIISDRYIFDGSYVRIQNVNLGYTFSSGFIKKVKLNKLKVYASAQNLYTFTKYEGYDPEIGLQNQNPLYSGVDIGRYPSARVITFGINAEF